MQTVQSATRFIYSELDNIYPKEEISAFVRIIFKYLKNFTSTDLHLKTDANLQNSEQSTLIEYVNRLKKYEPIQYIIGETNFFDLNFEVNPAVLIPRQETEELINLIINENKSENLKILDIGTGSGCIAISLAKFLEKSSVTAVDISDIAIQTAIRNTSKNNVNVSFIKTDILSLADNYIPNGLDIIVSNPPYVTESEKFQMQPNVLNFEPHLALFVPDNKALVFYEKITEIAFVKLNAGGKLYFEINESKAPEVEEILKKHGFSEIKTHKDINGKDRIVTGRK